jgi:2-dehydro-3-deoxy-D-pentonate aldolase
MQQTLPRPLQGIIVPLITPLAENEKLDRESLEKLIDYVITGGVNGIFILGTTGEGPSLSGEAKRELIDQTCKITHERVPVIVGVMDTSITESVNLAAYAADKDAAAVVAVPPYYLPLSQPELVNYIRKLTDKLPLPLFLYNQPEYTNVPILPDTLSQVADIANLAGLKDTSRNMINFQQMCRLMQDRDDFSLFVGPDGLMAEAVLMGGSGGVNAGANLAPKLYVELYHAARAGDLPKVHELQQIVLKLITTVYHPSAGRLKALKGLKCALATLGLCQDIVADPLIGMNPDIRSQMPRFLEELNLR